MSILQVIIVCGAVLFGMALGVIATAAMIIKVAIDAAGKMPPQPPAAPPGDSTMQHLAELGLDTERLYAREDLAHQVSHPTQPRARCAFCEAVRSALGLRGRDLASKIHARD